MTLLVRSFQAALHVRDGGDGRTLVGPVMPWGVEAVVLDRGREVVETFQRGALADVDPATVPLTATHPPRRADAPDRPHRRAGGARRRRLGRLAGIPDGARRRGAGAGPRRRAAGAVGRLPGGPWG